MHMIWTSDLNTGIAEIDSENRKIVEYVNQLTDARQAGDRQKLGEILDLLLDYVVNHFLFEEHLMEQANYQFFSAHEKVHELFAKKLADLRGRYAKGEDVFADVIAMLSNWVDNHVRIEDQLYAESVQDTIEKEGGETWVAGVMKRLFG